MKTALSGLAQLAAQIQQAHQECEQALTVARSAEASALELAKRTGELLLRAKQELPHGEWEAWRDKNTGIPSSTASLYQRVAEKWDEIQTAKIDSLRGIDRHFRDSKKQPLKLEPGQVVRVQDEQSPYAGSLVQVVECDGVVVKAKTSGGQIVPLLTSEIQPERQQAAEAPKPSQPNAFGVVEAKLRIEEERSLLLEQELANLCKLIKQRSSYETLTRAARQASRLLQADQTA